MSIQSTRPTERTPLRASFLSDGPEDEKHREALLTRYRRVVYFITFVAYAMSHFSRKSYTNVKKNMKDGGMAEDVLSQMDTGFMFCYAVGSFFSGALGDRLRPTTVVAVGLWGSAVMVMALTAGLWSDLQQNEVSTNVYFTGVWMIHGLFQSTGGPVNTSIMGNWVTSKNRGFIFGTWTCHQYIGNILAAVVTSIVLTAGLDFWWALVIPAAANAVWGVVCYSVLPPRPSEIQGLQTTSETKVTRFLSLSPSFSLSLPLSLSPCAHTHLHGE